MSQIVSQTNSLSLQTHFSHDDESNSTSPSSQTGSTVVVVAAAVVVIFPVVVSTTHVSSGALTAHLPLTWMASLSAQVQKTVHPSLATHSSCSPLHPKVQAHSSEQV